MLLCTTSRGGGGRRRSGGVGDKSQLSTLVNIHGLKMVLIPQRKGRVGVWMSGER